MRSAEFCVGGWLAGTSWNPTPERPMSRPTQPVEDRIAEYIDLDAESGCWIWTGPTHSGGYPALTVEGRKELVRLLVYRLTFGEPQSSLTRRPQIRMECSQKLCVCPEHMIVLDDAHRELQQLRREIYLDGLRRLQREPKNQKLRRLVSGGYVNWKAAKIIAERQANREAAQSPEVKAIIDSVRRKATITGAAPTQLDGGL